MKTNLKTGVKMTKKNRLAILKGARRILSNKHNWTHGRLRRKVRGKEEYRYCLLGAIEQATYDAGLLMPTGSAFHEKGKGIAYCLGDELSLTTYSQETRMRVPWAVNDTDGYEETMKMLDEYIAEVQKGKAR